MSFCHINFFWVDCSLFLPFFGSSSSRVILIVWVTVEEGCHGQKGPSHASKRRKNVPAGAISLSQTHVATSKRKPFGTLSLCFGQEFSFHQTVFWGGSSIFGPKVSISIGRHQRKTPFGNLTFPNNSYAWQVLKPSKRGKLVT